MAGDVYAADTMLGRGGWSIYTGAAGWYYRILLEDFFGVHICDGEVSIRPCLPPDWQECRLTMVYQNTTLDLHYLKLDHPSNQTVSSIPLDGKEHRLEIYF